MVSKRRFNSCLGAALLALFAFLSAEVRGDCYHYTNSQVEYHQGQAVCAGYGSGCTDCSNSGGSSCVTNGSSCTPEVRN